MIFSVLCRAALCCVVRWCGLLVCVGLWCGGLWCSFFFFISCCCRPFLLVTDKVSMTPRRFIRPARDIHVFIASYGDVDCGAFRCAELRRASVMSFLRWTIPSPSSRRCGADRLWRYSSCRHNRGIPLVCVTFFCRHRTNDTRWPDHHSSI